MKKFKTKTILLFTWVLSVLTGTIKLFENGLYKVDSYSTTLYAFSYQKYGFGSRMLLGSVYRFICNRIPSIETFRFCYWFMFAVALAMAVSFYLFGCFLLKKTEGNKNQRTILIIYCLMMAVLIPSHMAGQNFGKPDALMFIFTLLQAYLILKEKHMWAIPVLSLLQVMMHEGFLCMTACVAICMLLYKGVVSPKEQKLKWWLTFAFNLILICGPAVYFVFFKTTFDLNTWNEAFEYAKYLNFEGNVHVGVISQRLNISNPDYKMKTADAILKAAEIKETIPFLILFSPVLVNLFKPLSKMLKEKKHRILTIAVFLLGFVLIGVEFKLFCDFGRYVTWLVLFIAMLECCLLIEDEQHKDCEAYKPGAAQFIVPAVCIVLLVPIQSSYYSALSVLMTALLF